MHTKFWSENLEGRVHLEDLGIGGKVVLEWILWKMGWERVDWIHLAQDGGQWRAFVNSIRTYRFCKIWVIS